MSAYGAIAHDHGNHRTCDWFIPAERDIAHALYRRACDFGHGWIYQTLVVTAYRAGVELGRASLGGIESDSDERYFSDLVFDIRTEAIAEANAKYRELCGCH